MTLLLERQMKNILTGVCVPMEHRQTTVDLSAISTEALSQYQTVLFWHTENYSSFLNTATCLLSVSLKTRILSFKKFTVILVAPH